MKRHNLLEIRAKFKTKFSLLKLILNTNQTTASVFLDKTRENLIWQKSSAK